ncbi:MULTISPECIES: hypothetical protein [unclassified Streptomyces]|uniref:hypothetical protein n=1 Tax=unclassified Streptomyces TaxID=2593676 RepID=UPI0033BF3D2F
MQMLIAFGAAAGLVLVLGANIQVPIALGAVGAVAIVVKDMIGMGGERAGSEKRDLQARTLPAGSKGEGE